MTRFVDNWLWHFVRDRERNNKYREANLDKIRKRVRESQRRLRARRKQEPIDRLIASVYWHEVHYPTIPISQYKGAKK